MTVSATVLSEYLAKIPANTLKKGQAIFESQGSGSEDDVIEIDAEGPRSIIFAVPSQSDEFLYEVKLSWTAKSFISPQPE